MSSTVDCAAISSIQAHRDARQLFSLLRRAQALSFSRLGIKVLSILHDKSLTTLILSWDGLAMDSSAMWLGRYMERAACRCHAIGPSRGLVGSRMSTHSRKFTLSLVRHSRMLSQGSNCSERMNSCSHALGMACVSASTFGRPKGKSKMGQWDMLNCVRFWAGHDVNEALWTSLCIH